MEGVANSALTHSEPTAYLAGGAVASLTAYLASGLSLPKSLAKVARMLATAKGGDEVTLLLTAAIEQANKHPAYWTDDVEGGDIARQMADMLFVTEEKREV